MTSRLQRKLDKLFQGYQAQKIYNNNKLPAMEQQSDVAVVLHLYYPEMWDYFEKKLKNISMNFDLYVTVPESKKGIVPEKLRKQHRTQLFYVPNRGRDVLPFLFIAGKIRAHRYKAILKIHSKKSPHYESGNEWLDTMVDVLTKINVNAATKILGSRKTVIGPKNYYMSLEVNFEANGPSLHRILKKARITPSRIERIMQKNRDDFGFFGGTMFWISQELLNSRAFQWPASSFENESGQIDGTLAHALERAFTLLPEVDGELVYETDGKETYTIDCGSGTIPSWSDKYKADKP